MDNKSPIVIIVSGSCCMPGMEVLDRQAVDSVQKAITEGKVEAKVKVVPATSALLGGIPKVIVSKLMSDFNGSGQIGLPAILIDGEPVSYRTPDFEAIKAALLRCAGSDSSKKEQAHE